MEPIRASYRVKESDFMKSCDAHWNALGQGAAKLTVAGLASVLVGAVVAWYFPWGLIHTLALAIVGLGGLLAAIVPLRLFIWRRAYRDAKKFQDAITIEFTDDTIHVESAAGISDLKWNAYNRYLITPEFFILYMAKHTFSVIPRSAFSEDDQRSLQSLFEARFVPVK
jgi:hypothetical protein